MPFGNLHKFATELSLTPQCESATVHVLLQNRSTTYYAVSVHGDPPEGGLLMAAMRWGTLSQLLLALILTAFLLTSTSPAQAIGLGCRSRCAESVDPGTSDTTAVYE